MYTLVLVRHGESEWNKKKLFTGWTDVNLTDSGIYDAKMIGRKLKSQDFCFDVAFTSVLKRAGMTLELILEELNNDQAKIIKSWKLNERHYGKLQGKSKVGILEELDWKEIHSFRRGYYTKPPQLDEDDPRNPINDPKYSHVSKDLLTRGESLEDTYNRVIPFLTSKVYEKLKSHKNALIVSHGNTLRVMLKYLDNLSDTEIEGVEFPIGKIIIYKLDKDFKVIDREYSFYDDNLRYGEDL